MMSRLITITKGDCNYLVLHPLNRPRPHLSVSVQREAY